MYDILIVDDEPASLKALEYVLDWECHGFQIAGRAAGGREAFEMMAEQSYSLVVTDIRMPGMDGLELAERIRAVSDVPILILSGYEDFEYARKAMRIGVEDYLMKPVEAAELVDKLEAVRKRLETKTLTEQRLYHALPIMQDQWLRHWAHGLLDDLTILERLALPVPVQDAEAYSLMLVELNVGPSVKYDRLGPDMKIRRFAVRNIIEDLCGEHGAVFEESDARFGLIRMGRADELREERLAGYARELREQVLRYAKEAVTVSVGPAALAWPRLVSSYLAALRLLEDRKLTFPRKRERGPDAEGILVAQPLDFDREPQARQMVEKVKRLARERFHQNINLRLIAAEVYLNPTYLGQLFMTQEGVSFQQYLLSLRMENAKELLLGTGKKIYEIALEVGYREIDWFYKKFRDYEGMSPGEYREKHGVASGDAHG